MVLIFRFWELSPLSVAWLLWLVQRKRDAVVFGHESANELYYAGEPSVLPYLLDQPSGADRGAALPAAFDLDCVRVVRWASDQDELLGIRADVDIHMVRRPKAPHRPSRERDAAFANGDRDQGVVAAVVSSVCHINNLLTLIHALFGAVIKSFVN